VILMKKASLSLACMLAVVAILPGCKNQSSYRMTNVDYQLMQSALSIEDSLRTLAAAQESEVQHAINTDILVAPQGGMGGRASLDWSGPIEPLLERIANMSSYRVKVLGPIPPIPVIVTIAAKDRVVADILKDAGLQAGKRANIVVYPKHKVIELRYLNA
jgi:defect in organelle trafficking protein DotD